MVPKTLHQWIVIGSAAVVGGIAAWLQAGGPDPKMAGIPILAFLLSWYGTTRVPSTQQLRDNVEQAARIDRLSERLGGGKAP